MPGFCGMFAGLLMDLGLGLFPYFCLSLHKEGNGHPNIGWNGGGSATCNR